MRGVGTAVWAACALAIAAGGCGDSGQTSPADAGDATSSPVTDVVTALDVVLDIGADDATAELPEPVDPSAVEIAAEPATMQRLTRAQYRRSIEDVLGADIVVPKTLEPDVVLDGSTSLGAGTATVSAYGAEQYESAAFQIAAQALDEARRDGVVGCTPEATDTSDDECAADALARLARRLWRRPATEAELDALVTVAGVTSETLGDFYEGIGFGLAVILQSPAFLFRIEVGEVVDVAEQDAEQDAEQGAEEDAEQNGVARRRTSWEMASRLSFLLWDAPPDEALLDAAEAGTLTTPEGLQAEAERLLDSDRFRDGLRAFVVDWLELHDLDHLQKDPGVFLHMTPELGAAAREETLLGVERIVVDLDGDIRDLFTTRDTFLDHTLAAVYDVPAPAPQGFHLVELPADEPRRGVFGQAAFLAVHSHPTSSSATLRGKFIRERLLCTPVPIPPVNLSTGLPPATEDAPTKKDRSVMHNEDPSCAGCHVMMDPMGLGLERFDGIGRLRWTENGAVIDPSGSVDGVPFADAVGLGEVLREHPLVPGCFVRHVYRWASGRMETYGEFELIKALTGSFADDGHRVRALLMDVILSPGFRVMGEPVVEEPDAAEDAAGEATE